MRRAVLADAGPLYAAADPDDAYHDRAQRELKRLARDKREVLLAYPALAEDLHARAQAAGEKDRRQLAERRVHGHRPS